MKKNYKISHIIFIVLILLGVFLGGYYFYNSIPELQCKLKGGTWIDPPCSCIPPPGVGVGQGKGGVSCLIACVAPHCEFE